MKSSIEEDIKILEELLDEGFEAMCYEEAQAIEHILSDYKRVLKENEHKTEKIENQKAELAILNEKQKDFNKLQNTLSSYRGQFRRQEKENARLKKQVEYDNTHIYTPRTIELNYIPIQKIKKELRELKEEYMYIQEIKREKGDFGEENSKIQMTLLNKIEALQDLLN